MEPTCCDKGSNAYIEVHAYLLPFWRESVGAGGWLRWNPREGRIRLRRLLRTEWGLEE